MEKGEIYSVFTGLLKCKLKNEPLEKSVKDKITPELLPVLFRLSDAHDLSHIVGMALYENGLLSGGKTEDAFLSKINLSVFRYETINYEFKRICEIFEEEEIDYIPLKGAVLRELYPSPEMRTSCDIDIFVKPENVDNAVKVLEKKSGYAFLGDFSHDVSLEASSKVHLELHYNLDDADKKRGKIFKNVFDTAKLREGFSHRYDMSGEMFAAYFSAHMAKHFLHGGCGVRAFMDLYLIKTKTDVFGEKTGGFLSEVRLKKFTKTMLDLSWAWFGGGEMTPVLCELQEFVMKNGIYGTRRTNMAFVNVKKKSKLGYMLSRIFVPFGQLVYSYPVIKKFPPLYPFVLIFRCFKLIFNRKTRKNVGEELKINGGITKEEKAALLNLGEKAGLL